MPSRFSTNPPPGNFRFSGELRVTQKLSDYEFGVEIWVMREGKNRNNWDYRNLDKHYLTFVGRPILCAYVRDKIGDGHNMAEKFDRQSGKKYYSFTGDTAERIVGTLSDDPKDFTLAERDGHKWLVAKGRLFSFYAPELVEKIVRTGRMDVSAETEVKKENTEGDTEIYTDWIGLGVTILGDDVEPAIPGACIAALAAMQKEFNSVKLRAASLNSTQHKAAKKNANHKGVNRKMNKQAAARLAGKFEGFRIVGLSADGMRVALIDSEGSPYAYTFNEEDRGEVVSSRIIPAALSVSFNFDGEAENAVDADLADILEYVVASVRTEDADAKALRDQLETANQTISALNAAEHARRLQAVKDALKGALEEIRTASSGEDFGLESEMNALSERAEEFAALERDGVFCGDTEARDRLRAAHSAKVIEKGEERIRRERSGFAWNSGLVEPGQNGGIEEMLASING